MVSKAWFANSAEQYASRYGAYPKSSQQEVTRLTLFEDDDLVEQIVPRFADARHRHFRLTCHVR